MILEQYQYSSTIFKWIYDTLFLYIPMVLHRILVTLTFCPDYSIDQKQKWNKKMNTLPCGFRPIILKS